jgi:hypothetical protein
MTKWQEEIALPFVLIYRVARRQLPIKIAWWLMDTWWPFKGYRRLKMHLRLWKARRYRGTNEFHPSLNMDMVSMLEMKESELETYLDDLTKRRSRLHELSISKPNREKHG